MKNSSPFFYSGALLLFLLLIFSSPCPAQVGYDPNNFYSANNGSRQDNGNHNGHDNPNNPKSTTNVPIDDHIWILIAGGAGLFWYYTKAHKKQTT